MKNQITQTTLNPELKASIYEAFAKHAIESVGFDGLAGESVTFERPLRMSILGNFSKI